MEHKTRLPHCNRQACACTGRDDTKQYCRTDTCTHARAHSHNLSGANIDAAYSRSAATRELLSFMQDKGHGCDALLTHHDIPNNPDIQPSYGDWRTPTYPEADLVSAHRIGNCGEQVRLEADAPEYPPGTETHGGEKGSDLAPVCIAIPTPAELNKYVAHVALTSACR